MDNAFGKRIVSLTLSVANALIKSLVCVPKGICRFSPSCSDYAHEAVQKLPFWLAFLKIIWRVLRCHPFSRGGYDPVVPTIRKV
jgi:putative membrane protein insertion efficiency factor